MAYNSTYGFTAEHIDNPGGITAFVETWKEPNQKAGGFFEPMGTYGITWAGGGYVGTLWGGGFARNPEPLIAEGLVRLLIRFPSPTVIHAHVHKEFWKHVAPRDGYVRRNNSRNYHGFKPLSEVARAIDEKRLHLELREKLSKPIPHTPRGMARIPQATPASPSEEPSHDGEKVECHRNIPFSPFLVPASASLVTLADAILEGTESLRHANGRKRRDATERRREAVRTLLANIACLVAHYPEGTLLSLSARKDGATRYDRPKFPVDVLSGACRAMEQLGLLVVHTGSRGQWRTTIAPTAVLVGRIAEARHRGPIKVARRAGAETIILKAKTRSDGPKLLINYADTDSTRAMRKDMEALNTLLSKADIRLGEERPLVPVFLTRRFQIDCPEAPHVFDRHGRLYGGFWQSLPKARRHLLRIDGEPVADLDFAAMFVQLAYLHAGAAIPNSDPYGDIDGLPRKAVKKAVASLLCRQGAMVRLPSDLRQLVDPEWTGRKVEAAIRERHPAIAHLFGVGIGLRLMFTESEIMLATLRILIGQGIPVLPMHDGIMMAATQEAAARRAMARGSMLIVGTALPVVRKDI
ncbi:hypothetical protein [Aminobacter sp. MDW-2]|uniref:hypothetical protein n=1 Tax=Aminobacter sp. MDW-2 TaxID=2666139 RepID=UPI0012B0190B|nr:hypothetical protein [Aminobacter sp. MDW-2]MRX33845.1 hypothetical protein [Aminobacter sp. MDW-2]QNH34115.1 hypothetical protein H5P29_27290 [Aminobacter sp. MDW-2]